MNYSKAIKALQEGSDLTYDEWKLEDIEKAMVKISKDAFEAGYNLAEWECRSGDKKVKPKTFDEWLKCT